MQQAPILLPTLGWPDGTHEKLQSPPDFCWRIHIVKDVRPDSKRPLEERPSPLFDNPSQDVPATADSYKIVAVRHAKLLDRMNYTRQILFTTNIGAIHFEKNGDVVTVIHQLLSTHPHAFDPNKPEIYMEHRIDLDTPSEPPPTIGAPS